MLSLQQRHKRGQFFQHNALKDLAGQLADVRVSLIARATRIILILNPFLRGLLSSLSLTTCRLEESTYVDEHQWDSPYDSVSPTRSCL